MSRKHKKHRPDASTHGTDDPASVAQRNSRRGLLVGVVVALLVAVLAFVALRMYAEPEAGAEDGRTAALASEHAPSMGDPAARVHVVEFLDPACETCAEFYPIVKRLITENPGKIRLSVRHVAFHAGAEAAVRALEASRNQDMYWQALEALLQSQHRWTQHHQVLPDRIPAILASAGLDMDRLRNDMGDAAVTQRMEKDHADAVAAKVTLTPSYFVNGRALPSFGEEQLVTLVREELDRAY
jgi:protein-disulfide isomerase